QELADDFGAGEAEGLAEELDPLRLGERMLRRDPAGETAMSGGKLFDLPRIGDRGLDLQAVADDAGIGEQALHVALAVARDLGDREAVVGAAERLAPLQHQLPREARLIDLEEEALEQRIVAGQRETVLRVVI